MTPQTVIFSKKVCGECVKTKKDLEARNEAYLEISIDDETHPNYDPQAREKIAAINKNFRSAPVVVAKGQAWAGYKPEKIAEVFGS